MKILVLRVAIVGFAVFANASAGATLEQLSIEEMSRKATVIVRGRVSGCAGDLRGSVIYTRCTVAVSERWKGQTSGEIEFLVPGGTARGLVQTFTGSPRFSSGEEHILFLWAGRSGAYQIIGLSQGKFDLKPGKGAVPATVSRAASGERMLDKAGRPVIDEAVEMTANELRSRVQRALAGDEK
jgi:hypothetical protein